MKALVNCEYTLLSPVTGRGGGVGEDESHIFPKYKWGLMVKSGLLSSPSEASSSTRSLLNTPSDIHSNI